MNPAAFWSADRVGGAVWVIFGAAVAYSSWNMDRLTSLGVHPGTAPGLLPGLLGLGFIVFGAILLARSQPAAPEAPVVHAGASALETGLALKRVAASWILCMTYAGVLLGSGVHYWILTAAFLLLHIILIDETDRVPALPTLRRVVTAALLAPAIATAVMLVFQHIFLVRLP